MKSGVIQYYAEQRQLKGKPMPLLEEVITTLGTSAGIIAGLIIGVLANVIYGTLSLIFGKSKDAIFTFTKERSEIQKMARRRRVEAMRRDERVYHYHLALMHTQFFKAIVFLLVALINLAIMSIAEDSGADTKMILWASLAALCVMACFYFLFEGVAIQEDVRRSLPAIELPPMDIDGAPLYSDGYYSEDRTPKS